MTYIYDTETFLYDTLFVAKVFGEDSYEIIHNDNARLRTFLNDHRDDLFIGFNSKAYDQFILRGCAAENMSNEELKTLNDYLIGEGNGWQYPWSQGAYFRMNNVDIMDDMQLGLSLKAIECHLMMDIEETSVDFNIDRPLTEEELQATIHYCKHDVDATEAVVKLRKGYLDSKRQVGAMIGLSEAKSLSMTNAKLTAAMLCASPQTHTDERQYVIPDNLKREYIPQEVFDFFARMYDPTIPDEKLFKSKLKLFIGETEVTIGYGGIHAAIPHFLWKEAENEGYTIRNWDVSSYYPSLMIQNGYTSRNIPSADVFKDIYTRRIAAKKSGDKQTANCFKLVLNTTYGATLNRYNDLYDPLMARSVCISGQLYLCELAHHIYQDFDTKIVELNTDGIEVLLKTEDLHAIRAVVDEWSQRTRFGMEEETVQLIASKDVNNYVEVVDGEVKVKGGYLVRGIAAAGAFNINNNAICISDAIREYFVNGTDPAEWINADNDISHFQMIAKAGSKYREAFAEVDGQRVPVQKVNRVYAAKDTRYGKLHKIHAITEGEAKIASLPDHCLIDNRATATIDMVDKQFYIDMARKRINDFMGIKPDKKKEEKKMATTKATTESIYRKLAAAREEFLAAGIKKTGKNMQLKSMYFTLDDIVPLAMPIFHKHGLMPLTSFSVDTASLTVIDMDNPESVIPFTIPIREYLGNAAVTPVQAMGATVSYYRRFLYQVCLDIVEVDEMEEGLLPMAPKPVNKPVTIPVTTSAKIPVSEEQREAVKENLTDVDGPATELQIASLKKKLKDLRGHGDHEQRIAEIAVETKGFTEVTRRRCEELIHEAVSMMNE